MIRTQKETVWLKRGRSPITVSDGEPVSKPDARPTLADVGAVGDAADAAGAEDPASGLTRLVTEAGGDAAAGAGEI